MRALLLAAALAFGALPAIAAQTAPPCPCTYTLTQEQQDALVRALQAAQQFYGLAAQQTQALWQALAEQEKAKAANPAPLSLPAGNPPLSP